MACACGLVKSLIESGYYKSGKAGEADMEGRILDGLKQFFIGVKAIMAESIPKHETAPAENKEEPTGVMTEIRKAVGDANLETDVRKAGCTVKQLKDLWAAADADPEDFIEALEKVLNPETPAEEDSDDIPF
jgi:hypothetical protein